MHRKGTYYLVHGSAPREVPAGTYLRVHMYARIVPKTIPCAAVHSVLHPAPSPAPHPDRGGGCGRGERAKQQHDPAEAGAHGSLDLRGVHAAVGEEV